MGKARVRIAKDEMDRLGISSGNIVRVSGVRSTAAVCMPLDDITLDHDPAFEYLYNTDKPLPLVRPSDLVFQNAGGEVLSIVWIEKVGVSMAECVTVAARRPYTYRAESLDLQSLRGVPFRIGDRISIANNEPDSRFRFIEFDVIGAQPRADIYILSDISKFDFVPHKSRMPTMPKLSMLKRRLQVGKQISDRQVGIFLDFLEMYDDGWRIHLGIRCRFDRPEDWIENRIFVVAAVRDSKGTDYSHTKTTRVESHWNEGSLHHNNILLTLAPAINENASRIIVDIKEISWKRREKKDLQFLEQVREAIVEEPTVVTIWQQQKSYYLIAEGPWKFDIGL